MAGNSSIDLSLTNVWHSWLAFRAGKKPSQAIMVFESDLEYNLFKLCADLNSGEYVHGVYTHKIVNEKKRRDIHVATVRDRVVHRLVYDYLVPIVDCKFDNDVWSCRKGKGLHGCLQRTQQLLQRHPNAWLWRADISKFFDNVDIEILKSVLSNHVTDKTALDLIEIVINSYHRNSKQASKQGIPIGNLTSQIFANIYLNEFDLFVRQELKPLAYVRYGDDFILFGKSEMQVLKFSDLSRWFLNNKLSLNFHPNNSIVIKSKYGLHFLGHRIYSTGFVLSNNNYLLAFKQLSEANYASYLGLQLSRQQRRMLLWRLTK